MQHYLGVKRIYKEIKEGNYKYNWILFIILLNNIYNK